MEICALNFADFLALEILRILVASEKTLFRTGQYLTKYWFYEERASTKTCSSLSWTRCCMIYRMNIFQSSAYRKEVFVPRKMAFFQKQSKFPHFFIFPRNHHAGEMYPGMSFITSDNCCGARWAINGRILGKTEVHFKRGTAPLNAIFASVCCTFQKHGHST